MTIGEERAPLRANRPAITRTAVGTEGEPVVQVDGFAPDPDALRAAAAAMRFEPAGGHYPGIRAALPEGYLATQLPIVARALGRSFGAFRRIRVIDASFSMVTRRPAELSTGQRIPHVDGYEAARIALVHYLSTSDRDGTAFYRHRATGFETVGEERAAAYRAQVDAELHAAASPTGYIAGDTDLFERIGMVEAGYNRAVLYRSRLLHSGAISPDAPLSADPAVGRLTVTAFLAIER